ncbi:unnamed protein product, partial [Rotaria magnacalcarata]
TNEQTQQVRLSIEAQKKFVDKLVELTNIVKRVQGPAKVKVSLNNSNLPKFYSSTSLGRKTTKSIIGWR